MNRFFHFLHKYSFRSRVIDRILRYFQKRCTHLLFTYDSDTDCSYCDRCGKGFWSGNFEEELMLDAGIWESDEFESEYGHW